MLPDQKSITAEKKSSSIIMIQECSHTHFNSGSEQQLVKKHSAEDMRRRLETSKMLKNSNYNFSFGNDVQRKNIQKSSLKQFWTLGGQSVVFDMNRK